MPRRIDKPTAPPIGPPIGLAVAHKPGAVLLHRYPLLVYAPGQHGDFVATEDNGTDARRIARRAAEVPDRDELAAEFGTTREHVRDALRWAEDNPES
jgi:uncharacterized protein (DUF433 family)